MLKYPSIQNHYNEKNLNFWLKEHPKLKTVNCVAQQKYDGSNIGIEFFESEVNFFSRNTQLSENENFCGLREILKRPNYALMLETLKKWKSEHTEIKKVNLFGEVYGPGVQNRIDYGTKKQIKFFDVYFDSKIQTPLTFKKWMEELKLLDFVVEYLKIGTLDELLKSLNECKQLVNNEIEGVVIKPYEEIFVNSEETVFIIKLKVESFEDMSKPVVKKEKPANKTTRNLADYITVNRIQDCRGKQPWTTIENLTERVIQDAFNDYKKSIIDPNNNVEVFF